MRSDGVGGVVCGMRHSRGKQPVGDRLGIHVREVVGSQVMNEGLLEGLHELRDRPVFSLNRQDRLYAGTYGTRQVREPNSDSPMPAPNAMPRQLALCPVCGAV